MSLDDLLREAPRAIRAVGRSSKIPDPLFSSLLDDLAHDLRGTFVTLSLANGCTQAWVATRTGRRRTLMISRYETEAMTADELRLGRLTPLHLAIPELSAIEPKR